ncbi:MAG: hypothetical protein JKX70_03350 [Phycisphaerales bacterium]|nr:hypothetical protein [Phycisphaerales bacterium]
MAGKRKKGLTDIERSILSKLDQVLKDGTITDLQLAAKQIAKLWNEEHTVFQSQLNVRAEKWRRAYNDTRKVYRHTAMHEGAALMRLMHIPGIDPPLKEDTSDGARRRNPVLPSWHHAAPKTKILAGEVERFMELMDTESFIDIFDYGNKIINDQLYRSPLVVIQGLSVWYEALLPRYIAEQFSRPWDNEERDPEIALAFDYLLVVLYVESKWTYLVCDKYLERLPPMHLMKTTVKGRPGWKKLTAMLAGASLIQIRTGQTWELTKAGKGIADSLAAIWADTGNQ